MKSLFLWMTPCLAMLAAGTVVAQDPPSRVARLSYMTGQVSFEPASVDQWAAASLNYPLTTGDNLYTDESARAVLRVGRNSIRLNSGTNFQFVNVSDQVVQFSINSGSVSIRIRHLFEGESWEVDTPNGAVTLLREGEYRVDSDPQRNATMVTTRSGDVEVTANNQSFPVHSKETAYFGAGGDPDIRDENPSDDFDNFAYSRDRVEDVPPSRYVSPDVDGYEDLNANGSWETVADYGPIWRPRVAAGWAPYHDGHWAWVDPWGWTWVDDASWGFAPFHYGRWAHVGGSWGWCPGPVAVRPVYAPALVAFVGGSGFGISIGVGGGRGGAVGWFPLGPRDPYIPSYHVSPAYVRNVNITNTRITNINVTNVNVTNINYMNRSVPGAVAAMPQQAFATAQPVQHAMVQITPAQFQQARVVGMAPPVVPQRAAVLASSRPNVRVATPPQNVVNRQVVAKIAPPPPAVPFQARQQMLQQHPGQPVAPQQLQVIRQQTPAAATQRVQVRPINTSQVRSITPTVRTGAVPGGFNGQRGPAPNQATQPGPNQGRPQAIPTPQPTQPGLPGQARPQVPLPGQTMPRPQGVAPNQPGQRPAMPTPPNQARPAQQGVPGNQPGQPPPQATPPNQVRPQAQPSGQFPRFPQAQQPPAARPQATPPVREQGTPPARQSAPPVQQQAAPPQRQMPQGQREAAPPVRQQAEPPQRQAPPAQQQMAPPPRQAAPPVRQQAEPPQRQTPQSQREVAPPARQAAPPVRQQAEPPQRQTPQSQREVAPPQRQAHPAPPPKEEKKEDKKQ